MQTKSRNPLFFNNKVYKPTRSNKKKQNPPSTKKKKNISANYPRNLSWNVSIVRRASTRFFNRTFYWISQEFLSGTRSEDKKERWSPLCCRIIAYSYLFLKKKLKRRTQLITRTRDESVPMPHQRERAFFIFSVMEVDTFSQ